MIGVILAIAIRGSYILLIIGASLVVSVVIHTRIRAIARSQSSTACSMVGPAVSFLGWESTVNSFDMTEQYAISFLVANRNKVVNESHELRQVLNHLAPETKGPNVQRPRRYER